MMEEFWICKFSAFLIGFPGSVVGGVLLGCVFCFAVSSCPTINALRASIRSICVLPCLRPIVIGARASSSLPSVSFWLRSNQQMAGWLARE